MGLTAMLLLVVVGTLVAATAGVRLQVEANGSLENDAALRAIVEPEVWSVRVPPAVNYVFEDACKEEPDAACLNKCFEEYSSDRGKLDKKGYLRCCREVFPDEPLKCCSLSAELKKAAPLVCQICNKVDFEDDCSNSCAYQVRKEEAWFNCYSQQAICLANKGCCKQNHDDDMCYCFFRSQYDISGRFAEFDVPQPKVAKECCFASFENPDDCCRNNFRGVFDGCCDDKNKWTCNVPERPPTPKPEGSPTPKPEDLDCDMCSFVQRGKCISACPFGLRCARKGKVPYCVKCDCFFDKDGDSCCVNSSMGMCKPRKNNYDKCTKKNVSLIGGRIPNGLFNDICWDEENMVINKCACLVKTNDDGTKFCSFDI